MSLRVIKAGILDSIQDMGRTGFQHLGINPGGAMDRFSAAITNILVGNSIGDALIEMHFPSAAFLFEEDTLIALGGGDFFPTINGEHIPLWHPILVCKNSVLQFNQLKTGARCYLAIGKGLNISPWLNSYSTHLKAAAGGFHGRALQKNDCISFNVKENYADDLLQKDIHVLPWKADLNWNDPIEQVAIIEGNEWDWLEKESQSQFLSQPHTISMASDRMGYRLEGTALKAQQTNLVSSAVNFGTIQLLPDGQLILLMADHQTTGGYPRIGHVITAHHSKLAQMRSGETIYFKHINTQTAESLLIKQKQHLQQLENACTFRLSEYLKNGYARH